jgi:hypothetical protein
MGSGTPRLGLKLSQRSDVRRLVEVLGKRVTQGSEDLSAAVAELQQLRANNTALAAQLKAATEGQALDKMEARVKQVQIWLRGWVLGYRVMGVDHMLKTGTRCSKVNIEHCTGLASSVRLGTVMR